MEVEVAGKRTHFRTDTGNGGPLMLLKSTVDYLEIKQRFHPLHTQITDPFGNIQHPPMYNIPLTLIGVENNITVNAPTMLAEDINPTLDNDIIPSWLFLKNYAISFYPDHLQLTPYPYIPGPGAVSIPIHHPVHARPDTSVIPLIEVKVNSVSSIYLIDSAGSANMISHEVAKKCRLHRFPKGPIFKTTDSQGTLILRGYNNVPVQVAGLPPIFTNNIRQFQAHTGIDSYWNIVVATSTTGSQLSTAESGRAS